MPVVAVSGGGPAGTRPACRSCGADAPVDELGDARVVGCEDARGDYGAERDESPNSMGWVERMPVARTS